MSTNSRIRADSWLWAVRLYKTRSAAARACTAGHVRINDSRAKPATPLHIGDEIRALTPSGERTVVVRSAPTRRVSAAEAVAYFEDRTPPPVAVVERPAAVTRERGAGRPTKRDRRALERLRGRTDPQAKG